MRKSSQKHRSGWLDPGGGLGVSGRAGRLAHREHWWALRNAQVFPDPGPNASQPSLILIVGVSNDAARACPNTGYANI